MNVAKEISRVKEDYIPSVRVLKRIKYEEQTRKLLSNISDISFDDFDTIISLIDSDYWEDEEIEWRFYPLFSKPNRNKIATNSLEQIKQLLKAAYQNGDMSEVDTLVSDLSGMWYGSASLFFYI